MNEHPDILGHGHVRPRRDGVKARCGGPGICAACSREKSQHDMMLSITGPIDPPTPATQPSAEPVAWYVKTTGGPMLFFDREEAASYCDDGENPQPLVHPSPADEAVKASDLCALLPGSYYMDPPDGGDVSIMEQIRRMAKDAARYRWLLQECYRWPPAGRVCSREDQTEPVAIWTTFEGDDVDAAIDAAIAKATGVAHVAAPKRRVIYVCPVCAASLERQE